jgi:type IV secretory pathway TraG/TraD family ATPase VirD4
LPRVENLTRLLPEGRKFGASVVITFQAIGQMQRAYGKETAEAMLGCCNTKLYLQTIDAATRLWCSETIGQVEAEIGAESDTKAQGKRSQTQSLSRQTRPAILESEFRLPPYQGFIQMPDGLPVARVKLTDTHIKARVQASNARFLAADDCLSLYHVMGEAMPLTPTMSEGLI